MNLYLLIYSDTLFYIWILVFPIRIIEASTPRIWRFLLHFSSLHDFWLPSIWKYLVHTSWGKMEKCEKRAFQVLKMRKKKWPETYEQIAQQSFYWQLDLREWRSILVITRWTLNCLTYKIISKIFKNLEIFFTRKRVCKYKEVDTKLHVCTNDLLKMCAS